MITSLQPLIMIVWLELGGGNYGLMPKKQRKALLSGQVSLIYYAYKKFPYNTRNIDKKENL